MKLHAVFLRRASDRRMPRRDQMHFVSARGHALGDRLHETADAVPGKAGIRRRDHHDDVGHVTRPRRARSLSSGREPPDQKPLAHQNQRRIDHGNPEPLLRKEDEARRDRGQREQPHAGESCPPRAEPPDADARERHEQRRARARWRRSSAVECDPSTTGRSARRDRKLSSPSARASRPDGCESSRAIRGSRPAPSVLR